jgi:hypothetical protein
LRSSTGDPDLFDRVRRSGAAILLACDEGSIDFVGPALGQPRVELLHLPCEPADYALGFAALALGGAPNAAAEGDPAGRLLQISEEVARITRALALEAARPAPPACPSAVGAPVAAASLRAMLDARRLREGSFAAGLFGEPVWDMLLELTAPLDQGSDDLKDGRRVFIDMSDDAFARMLAWVQPLEKPG